MGRPEQLTLLLVITDEKFLKTRETYFRELIEACEETILVSKKKLAKLPGYLQDNLLIYFAERGKVAALNEAAKQAKSPFIFILEEDETISLENLPAPPKPDSCYRFLIDVEEVEKIQQNYQIRLFPNFNTNDDIFSGYAIPDLTLGCEKGGWTVSSDTIPLLKTNSLIHISEVEKEINGNKKGALNSFWKAVLDSENQKFVRAEANFRAILKNKVLFEFDRLAALNGLANALVEQHKLDEAEQVANKSLAISIPQRSPYLTLYKINRLHGNLNQAYRHLHEYMKMLGHTSSANLDIYLPPAEAHFLMADTKFRQADYTPAFHHYEEFYKLNEGKVSLATLEKLFIYAIELQDYQKSVKYFNDIFGDYLPGDLDEEMSARLLESLSLFMDNEWYDFVSDIYEQLLEHDPEDNKLLHGWITTLIKNKEVEKARTLISCTRKKQASAGKQ